jgi:hypothetical protein
MSSGKLVPVAGKPPTILPAEEKEPPPSGEESTSTDLVGCGKDGCRIVWAWFQETDAGNVTADRIVAGIQATGHLKSPGRIKEHVNHLAEAGKLATEGAGVRGDPVRYSPVATVVH